MTDYRLAKDGDSREIRCWHLFVQSQFPSYETFWIRDVVPLTNRPTDFHFKTDQELLKIGKTHNDICIAQLHYSILVHLERAYEMLSIPLEKFAVDYLAWGLTSIVAAQDIAFELLQRNKSKKEYDPWLPLQEKKGDPKGSREAKREWQKRNGRPLQHLRDYRNDLVHGRALPTMMTGFVSVPNIGRQRDYFNWRLITDPVNNPGYKETDYVPARQILEHAWKETVDYFETSWQTHLRVGAPKIRSQTTAHSTSVGPQQSAGSSGLTAPAGSPVIAVRIVAATSTFPSYDENVKRGLIYPFMPGSASMSGPKSASKDSKR